jgi:nitrite reductase/ring-hydroxylating ferredoxin subunit
MWVALTDFEAPEPGELTAVKLAGRRLVLAEHEGCLHALDDRCPHMGVALSQMGRLGDGQIVCAWHGASIDVRTGRCESFPDVQTYPVEVRGDGVYVRIEDQALPPDESPTAS